ncbi:MAG TPA: prephenate dehydrogenase [Bacillus bacterium]|uniref:Prephenate dehydrogenase n=1 Tax=Siminovitchia fordii TaxID=254759 RepID=A0ABQ4K816_9BACI|nr:prephenate dehydrogenase [Siminovitchia fordii]GIN21096.1 prephenate dehydrogenase [Siminovitchia fordii]HBZ09477.1 prephenate dehydrogenase [Bacillus sp. (in: firmicutes)]
MDKRVLIIGVGLIGGSIALAIKKEHPGAYIIGYDLNEENCRLAERMNIIDECSPSFEKEAVKSDLIILACPVEEVEQKICQLAELPLKPEAIITDVGSTKVKIMEKSAVLRKKGAVFIGGHPMAGSHKSGAGSARKHLFENAFYILTPAKDTNEEIVCELKDWLKGTGANFVIMEPEEHDMITGVVSHLPHLIAAGIVSQVEKHSGINERVRWLAAGGFRDITRIASSSPAMWGDIVKHNQSSLLSLIDEWIDEMKHIKELVQSGNKNNIYNYFANAKKFRDSLPVRARGAIDAFYDLYVDVLDKPGVISHVTTILAEKKISLTNIRILEAREDVFGVLRLSFQTEEDRQKARDCLNENDYETYLNM